MRGDERRIVITGRASVVRKALYILMAGMGSAGDLIPGTRERLEEFARHDCHNMILDLRAAEAPLGGFSPGVTSVRSSQVGRVAVVSCEISAPWILHQIEELCRPHFFPKHLASSLRALIHIFF